jgi:hypothetical protein
MNPSCRTARPSGPSRRLAQPRQYVARKGDLTEERANGEVAYLAVIELEGIETRFPLGTNLARAHELDFELRRRLRIGDDVAELMAWLPVAAKEPPKAPLTCALVPQLANAYLSCSLPKATQRQAFLSFLRVTETVELGKLQKHCYSFRPGGRTVTTADYPALANVTVEILLDDIWKKYRDIRLKGLDGTPAYETTRRSAVQDIHRSRSLFIEKALEHYRALKKFTLPNVAPFMTEDIGSKDTPPKKLDGEALVPIAMDAVLNAPTENTFRAGVLALFHGLSKGQIIQCHTKHIEAEGSEHILLVGKKRQGFEASLARRLLTVPGFVMLGETEVQRRTATAQASVYYAEKLGVARGLSVLATLWCCREKALADKVTAVSRIGWTSTLARRLLKALPEISLDTCKQWQVSFSPEPLIK